MKETVLCYIEKDHSYLMLLRNKKKNDLNANKWIGIGGHIEDGETKENALLREVKEETGLLLKSFDYRAKLTFINDDYFEIMYLYTSKEFVGELIKCNEGDLSWIDIDKIMDLNLWEGDRPFLKLLQENSPYFEMTLTYSKDKLLSVVKNK